MTTLIQTQGIGDLYRIYSFAQRGDIGFNLASIPPSFNMKLEKPFDTKHMNDLFRASDKLGKAGYCWANISPGYDGVNPVSTVGYDR